jgi:hypothetical protein
MSREESKNTIDQIYEKYKTDEYMISKINHYISVQLPNILDNICSTRQKNILRIEEISLEQEQFIRLFLNRNHYFYVSATEKFLMYYGKQYMETTEDNILYHILTAISQEHNPKLISWKHKTKVSILKIIKETRITKIIPESDTIQNVLNILYPSLFSSKTEVKYFLTVLGDNLLKKNTNHIHFLSTNICKTFLKELNQCSLFYFGNQCIQTFKTKCHEKHYEGDMRDCRMIITQQNLKYQAFELAQSYLLNILGVAFHYSVRYNNSDIYLSRDLELEKKVMKLSNTNIEGFINVFIEEYIYIPSEKDDKCYQITWQNMLYLWKLFLKTHQYPSNLYQSNLKHILTTSRFEKYYKSEGDFFIGIGSSQWSNIQLFLKFWNETMMVDEFEMDLEIEEISGLFRYWGESLKWKNGYLNEPEILDAISYFFPEIEIEKQKYIHHFRCSLWEKTMDIQVALQEFSVGLRKEKCQSPPIVSIYDTYLYYCKFYSNPNKKTQFLVSKSYFEKYMMDNYNHYIMGDGILSIDWIDSM